MITYLFVFATSQSQVVSDTTKSKSLYEKNALIVVDGIMMEKRGIHNLDSTFANPNNIEKISVLKGKNAIDKYGEKGKDGVIEIFLKQRIGKVIQIGIEEVDDNSNKDSVFYKVEIEPAFRGGEKAWMNFLVKNWNAAIPIDNGAPDGKYTVILQFIVDKNGIISDLKPLTAHGYGMEEECIRLMKLSPLWLPGIQNGEVVTAIRKQPFTYVITSE